MFFFFFQAEDGIRGIGVTGVQTCALPICRGRPGRLRALPSQDWYSVIAWISSTEYVRRYGPLVRRFGTALQVQPGTPLAEEALAFERIPNYSHDTHPE